jgi:predicted DNA-binding protein YlxM (UPF0122 family)
VNFKGLGQEGFFMEKIHANIPGEEIKWRNMFRDRIDLLRSRAELLTGKDKALMTMYLKNGTSFRQMARLAGVNEASIARRIYKIIQRLIDGEYITCLRSRDKFTPTEMKVSKDYFVEGLSMKKIAKKRGLTYYRVRQTLKKIERLIRVLNRAKAG